MIQDTSLIAYFTERDKFYTRTKQVLALLKTTQTGLTDNEIMFNLGYQIPNMVRPRRNELYKKGLVICCGTRKCNITNRLAKIWKAKDEVKENGRCRTIEQQQATSNTNANRSIEVY